MIVPNSSHASKDAAEDGARLPAPPRRCVLQAHDDRPLADCVSLALTWSEIRTRTIHCASDGPVSRRQPGSPELDKALALHAS